MSRRPARAFWISAGAGATLWIAYSVYLNSVGGSDLAVQVAGIFTGRVSVLAGTVDMMLMLAIAVLVVALVSGFSGLAGLRMRQLMRPVR